MDELRFEYEVTRRRWEEEQREAEQRIMDEDQGYQEWLDKLESGNGER